MGLLKDRPSGTLWVTYSERDAGIDSSRPKLYFVKVDVQACFDSIEQSTLLKILKELISEVVHQAA